MEDDVRNGIIVDAKRRAKALSKSTGQSHQKSLDRIARLRGREDWAAFLADPVQERQRTCRWMEAVGGCHDRWPRAAPIVSLLFMLTSMIVLVACAAEYGVKAPIHVPDVVWLPFAMLWTYGTLDMFRIAGIESFEALKEMKRGVVDSRKASLLVNGFMTVMLAMFAAWGLKNGGSAGLLVAMVLLLGFQWWFMFQGPRNPLTFWKHRDDTGRPDRKGSTTTSPS